MTLEPCAHRSPRGPACADLIAEAGVARVVAGIEDPDERTAGGGFARLRAAGIDVTEGVRTADAVRAMAGFLMRQWLGRAHVTLKLATSLDGRIALHDGSSRWITVEEARAHAHLERSRVEAIVVGRGTWETDRPRLDVRLEGLEDRSPRKFVLTSSPNPVCHPRESGGPVSEPELDSRFRGNDIEFEQIASPEEISALPNVDHVLVEGGAGAAAAFLRADLVDRLLLYRAPILIGDGLPAIGDIGLDDLAEAHGRWQLSDARMLGSDRLEVYERVR